MTWNYRVIRSKDPDGEYYYAIHEVYYNNNQEPDSWSRDAIRMFEYSMSELEEEFGRLRKAMSKTVLEEFEGKLVEVE